MSDYQKLYTIMFNAATDVLEELDKLNIGTAKQQLREAQSQAEDLYISQDEDSGDPEPPESPGECPPFRHAPQSGGQKSFFI